MSEIKVNQCDLAFYKHYVTYDAVSTEIPCEIEDYAKTESAAGATPYIPLWKCVFNKFITAIFPYYTGVWMNYYGNIFLIAVFCRLNELFRCTESEYHTYYQ